MREGTRNRVPSFIFGGRRTRRFAARGNQENAREARLCRERQRALGGKQDGRSAERLAVAAPKTESAM